ncbi:MAG: glycosyltransferase [Marinilabiliaceae bacterium]|nr:glycosyltransferase [Marinilabiliaceae bacterium]
MNQSNKKPSNPPIVSICMITYNHKTYIKEAIEGVLMQITKFPIKLIIGEDNSQDNTRLICEDYQRKFPDLIELLPSKENLGMMPNFIRTLKACNGKYIALCEGDDYWTDPLKLQKQIDILENNPNLIACHHWHEYLYEYEDGYAEIKPASKDGFNSNTITSVKDIFANTVRLKTRTVVYRNVITDGFFPKWLVNMPFGDVPLSILMGRYGSFHFINEVMAVYRITDKGVSSIGKNSLSKFDFLIEHMKKWIVVWDYANFEFNFIYNKEANATIRNFNSIIIKGLFYKDPRILELLKFNIYNRNCRFINKLDSVIYIIVEYFRKILIIIKIKISPLQYDRQ